jgi:TPR repeat protein
MKKTLWIVLAAIVVIAGGTYFLYTQKAGKIKEMIAEVDHLLQKCKADNDAESCFIIGSTFLQKKDYGPAVRFLKMACEKEHAFACTNLGFAERKRGNFDAAIKFSDMGCKKDDNMGCYNLACYYCVQNQVDNAVNALGTAFEKGYKNFKLIEKDPDLDCMRTNPKFLELITKFKK